MLSISPLIHIELIVNFNKCKEVWIQIYKCNNKVKSSFQLYHEIVRFGGTGVISFSLDIIYTIYCTEFSSRSSKRFL